MSKAAGLTAAMLLVAVAAGAGWARPPEDASGRLGKHLFAQRICGEIGSRAAEHGLPRDFLARLIWKESRFNPAAVSYKGAQGIAQFMPDTARLRGLDDPFDPLTAVASSAAYLGELKRTFGNLGLAAAAYNAGEARAAKFRDGTSGLPYETQDYVLFITGRSHDEWKAPQADYPVPAIGRGQDFAASCVALVLREASPTQPPSRVQAAAKPWGAVIAAGFSESRALQNYRRVRASHGALLQGEEPFVLRKRNRSMGRRMMVQVAIGRDSRADAVSLCRKLAAQGAPCIVARAQ